MLFMDMVSKTSHGFNGSLTYNRKNTEVQFGRSLIAPTKCTGILSFTNPVPVPRTGRERETERTAHRAVLFLEQGAERVEPGYVSHYFLVFAAMPDAASYKHM